MSKTVVRLSRDGLDLHAVVLSDEDATTQAIAEAALELILKTGMSMHVGDVLVVEEVS